MNYLTILMLRSSSVSKSPADTLKTVINGVSPAQLDEIEQYFPGIKAIAYKALLLEVMTSTLTTERRAYAVSVFFSILGDAEKIRDIRTAPQNKSMRLAFKRAYASRLLDRSSAFYYVDDTLDWLELYMLSHLRRINPLLVFVVEDSLSRWGIECGVDFFIADQCFDEIKDFRYVCPEAFDDPHGDQLLVGAWPFD